MLNKNKLCQVDDAFSQLMNEISMITDEISSKSNNQAHSPPFLNNPKDNFSILSAINLEKSLNNNNNNITTTETVASTSVTSESPTPLLFPSITTATVVDIDSEYSGCESGELRLNVVRLEGESASAVVSEFGDENISCAAAVKTENEENDADESGDEITSLNSRRDCADDSIPPVVTADLVVNEELDVTVR